MREAFAEMLSGGHPNSLGRTGEAVQSVLADQARLDELFACLDDPSEVVRMRAGDALEKVCREQPGWFEQYVEWLLGDVGQMRQPSVMWHVAQMLDHLHRDLSVAQQRRATELLKRDLIGSTDWIVLNVTVESSPTGRCDPALAAWLTTPLERLRQDPRRSGRRAGVQATGRAAPRSVALCPVALGAEATPHVNAC